MRIIGGTLRGLRLTPPTNLPVRPTTDLSKEALFNILQNRFDFEALRVLDLFSGTGNISLEFASRGVPDIVSVDLHYGCVQFLKQMATQHGLNAITPVKSDVFKYLARADEGKPFSLIFADAPFDHPKLPQLPAIIREKKLLDSGKGVLIMEHPSTMKFDHDPFFIEQRKYGYSSFSFFSPPLDS